MVDRVKLWASVCGILLGACRPERVADLTCSDVGATAISISGGDLIKITQKSETMRTEDELTCHGTALFRDGSQPIVRYRAWRDEDRDIMVAWDTDEADEAAWQKDRQEALRENAKAQREAEQEIDRIFAEAE